MALLNSALKISSQHYPTKRFAYWRENKASETLSGVYKFELVQYVYIY